jgi:hypothetical protein
MFIKAFGEGYKRKMIENLKNGGEGVNCDDVIQGGLARMTEDDGKG